MTESKLYNVVLGLSIPVIIYSLPLSFDILFRYLLGKVPGVLYADMVSVSANILLVLIALFLKKSRSWIFEITYFVSQVAVLMLLYICFSAFFSESDLVFIVSVYQAICILNVTMLIVFLFYRLYVHMKKYDANKDNQL